MQDDSNGDRQSALQRWVEQGGQGHDPLCPTPWLDQRCLGCMLVSLRSDATHEAEPEVRSLALAALADLVSLAQAHLDDALSVEPR